MADASGLFDASFKRKELIECGCNMHSRRRLTEALDAGDTRAALPLAAYKKLYDIEEEFKHATVEERRLARQARSKPLFKDLLAWALAHRPYEPPATGMGQAIGYLYNHRVALGRFLGRWRRPHRQRRRRATARPYRPDEEELPLRGE